jgi:hypothetical protein
MPPKKSLSVLNIPGLPRWSRVFIAELHLSFVCGVAYDCGGRVDC